MKTIQKISKVKFLLLAFVFAIVMTLTLTSCNQTSDQDEVKDPIITKYDDAVLDASVTMGPMGSHSFGGVLAGVYITEDNSNYSLTLIFTAGELEVGGIKGKIFVDDNPTNPTTTNGIVDGTLGVYNSNGDLITEGVKATYSSGEDYEINSAQEEVYYVKSAEFPVDSVREEYDITLFINSAMMGKQFSKDTYQATIKVDLTSGKEVSAISGLGVETLGTVSSSQEEGTYTKYEAELNSVVSMGQDVNFTENLLEGVYVTNKNDQYEITLIFTADTVNMPFGNVMTGFLTSAESVDYNNNLVTPVFGYYVGETLVTEGVSLTYSSGNDYVTIKGGSYYYVQSMTFTVDSLEENYVLALYVMAGNESSSSSMQFPYTLKNGNVCNAELTLNLEESEAVDSIEDLLGVETLGTVSSGQEEGTYTKYESELNSVVSMGQDVNFTENLLEGVYVTNKNDQYEITLIFTADTVNMPFGNVMTGFLTSAESVDYNNNLVTPVFGYYVGETLVTEGVSLTYSSGNDYVTIKGGSYYYVQSMTFTVDSLEENYVLALYVMAGNESSSSSMQFPYTLKNGNVCNAELTLNLEESEAVDSIEDLLGVETLGTVSSGQEEGTYTKYESELNSVVSMGQDVNFTENLLEGVYVTNKNDQYEITLIFTANTVNMPFGNVMTGFLTSAESVDYNNNLVTPVFGYYVGETLVTEGVSLTYSSGNDYVTIKGGSYYYVQSMTFTVDSLEENYVLALYVMAGNESSSSSMQFPYTLKNGNVCNAELTLNLEESEAVDSIEDLLGVETLGTVSSGQEEGTYTKYEAELNSVVSMGQDVNFTENLLEGVYVTNKNDQYEITLIFTADTVNMPFGNVMTGFLTSAESVDYNNNLVTPVFGYYVGETLVTEGVSLTYSSGKDYVTIKGGSYYYVQSMTFTVDSLEENYVLALYVMAGNESSSSSMQFPYTLKNGNVCNAELTLNLEESEAVDSIEDLLGVETLGTVVEEA